MRITLWLAAIGIALATPAAAQTLRVALEFDPAPLDPATDGSYTNRVVTTVMCDSLINLTPELKFIPELATAWDWSADGLALTLKLRPGVVFQDGTPFDAAGMVANIMRYKTLSYSNRKGEMAAISGAEVIDPLTMRISLSRPYAPLVMLLANRIGTPYSPKILDLPRAEIEGKPVCAGPFSFRSRLAQDNITLDRFAGYWNADAIKLSSVVFRTVTDSNIRKVDLQAGGLEIAQKISPTDVAAIAANPRLKVAKSPSLGFVPIEFNIGNGPAANTPLGRDARVRRAFSLAIDREALNQVAFDGQYVPSHQMEAPGNPYYHPGFPVPKRDVAAAKKLLAEAGVSRVSFTLRTGTDPLDAQVAQIVQSMVAEAGFDMKIVVQDSAALVSATRGGDFEASMLLWSGRPDPDGNAPIWMSSKGFTNWGKYLSPEIDALFDKGASGQSMEERRGFYHAATEIFLRDQPHVVLYHWSMLWGMSARVQGFKGRPDGLWRPEGLSLSQ